MQDFFNRLLGSYSQIYSATVLLHWLVSCVLIQDICWCVPCALCTGVGYDQLPGTFQTFLKQSVLQQI